MKKLTIYFLTLLFATWTAVLSAQTSEKPAPGFTLTISEYRHGFGLGTHRLSVIETNISKEVIREGGCSPLAFRAGVNIVVVYNGVPLSMEETYPAVQQFRKRGERPGPCKGSVWGQEAQPGGGPTGAFESFVNIEGFYDMTKPGTYEVTVTKETFPHSPEKSVTVRSNTLTIVVPEQEAVEPK